MGLWSNFTPSLGAHCFEGTNCQASNPVKDYVVLFLFLFISSKFISNFLFPFETGPHSVALPCLEFTMWS